jgi:hypothetical protein
MWLASTLPASESKLAAGTPFRSWPLQRDVVIRPRPVYMIETDSWISTFHGSSEKRGFDLI